MAGIDGRQVRILGEVRPGEVTLFSEVGGALTRLADVVLDRRTDEPIRFDPTATGSKLPLAGPLNALRPAAYKASRDQAASAPGDGVSPPAPGSF